MESSLIDHLNRLQQELGPLIALLTLGTLVLVLPKPARRKLIAPLAFFFLWFGATLLQFLVPAQSSAARGLHVFQTALIASCIGLGLLALLADGILGRRRGKPIPKIFRDVATTLMWFLVALAGLREAGVEPGSLLTTSALLTAVIGLSLQDTLSNVFAGLSIQAQTPFEVGDWLQVTDTNEPLGKVTEINWRATKILTNDRVEIVIPNGIVAKASIRNFSRPTTILRRNIVVSAPYSFSPEHVKAVLLACVSETSGTVADPAPDVLVDAFAQDGVTYKLRYWTDRPGDVHPIDSAVRERIWYGFRRAGIAIPFPQREIRVHQAHDASAEEQQNVRLKRRIDDLRRVDLFAALDDVRIRQLAGGLFTRRYAPGEVIIRKGDAGHELFIIEHGKVAVVVPGKDAGELIEVARLGSGKFFGEMSLMTGENRTATCKAVGDVALLVVDKRAFGEVLQAAPEVAEKVSEILAARQQALKARATGPQGAGDAKEAAQATSMVLLGRIRDFFGLS
jgi:small-conductance mechanosensitive channel/CRP-like cAMP-binding protein